MSDEEEELGIIIKDGQKEENFTFAEAKDGSCVQARFGLDSTPEHVLNIKGKPVKFDKLKDGMTYKLPKSQIIIPNQKLHTQNGVTLSQAVYDENPTDFVSKHSSNNTIKSICDITKHSKQRVMLAVAEVEEKNVLYVAYKGSDSREDFIADIDIKLTEKETLPGGKFHRGFKERSNTVPMEYILECANNNGCQTIVTTGHSLGGSVSSIVALDLMKMMKKDETVQAVQVYNITFGAPFFGNEAAREMCKNEGFDQNILHYVDYLDIVPGLLLLEHTRMILKNQTELLTDNVYLENIRKHPETIASTLKFVLDNVPFVESTFSVTKTEVTVLSELCSQILAGFRESDLGQKYSDEMFVPIGSYILLENGASSVLDNESVTPQVTELVLKDRITKVKTMSEIKEGHKIASYYKNLALSKFRLMKTVEQGSFFNPTVAVSESTSIVWTKEDSGGWTCQLAATGRFLQSPQMSSPHNVFSGFPFNTAVIVNERGRDDNSELIYLSGFSDNIKEGKEGVTIVLTLTTTFGIINLHVNEVRESKLKLDKSNISVTEHISTIIQKSVTRSLAGHIIKGGDESTDPLRARIDESVNDLDYKNKKKYDELKASLKPLSLTDDIKSITDSIIENSIKTITIHQEQKGYQNYKNVNAQKNSFRSELRGQDMAVDVQPEKNMWQQFKEWSTSTLQEVAMYFEYLMGGGELIEENYVEQLETVIKELRVGNILKTDQEKEDLFSELQKYGNTKSNPMSAYLLERILMSYNRDRQNLIQLEVQSKDVWKSLFLNLVNKSKFDDYCSFNEKLSTVFFNSLPINEEIKEILSKKAEQLKETKEIIFKNADQLKTEVLSAKIKHRVCHDWSHMREEEMQTNMSTLGMDRDREDHRQREFQCKEIWKTLFLTLVNNSKFDDYCKFYENQPISSDDYFNSLPLDEVTKGIIFKNAEQLKEIKEIILKNADQLKREVYSAKIKHRNGHDWSYIREEEIETETNMSTLGMDKSKDILADLSELSQNEIMKKISIFKNLHAIRQMYGKQCYIGFVGPQNAGKSTLLNNVFHKTAETGYRTHTLEPTRYHVADDVIAVDFPGSNSLTDISNFTKSGHMNNFLVYVMRYDGNPDQQQIDNVKLAYKIKRLSTKSAQTLFCLNKAGETGETFDDKYRTKFVNIIRDYIKTHDYDEKEVSTWNKLIKATGVESVKQKQALEQIKKMNEELRDYTVNEIQDDDFIFTDWIDKDAHKRGIKGPDEVKRRIIDYLVKSNIRNKGETL